MATRQVEILKRLLASDKPFTTAQMVELVLPLYGKLKNPLKALIRDLNGLLHLGALVIIEGAGGAEGRLQVNLAWPTEITETEFFRIRKTLPRARTHRFLQ